MVEWHLVNVTQSVVTEVRGASRTIRVYRRDLYTLRDLESHVHDGTGVAEWRVTIEIKSTPDAANTPAFIGHLWLFRLQDVIVNNPFSCTVRREVERYTLAAIAIADI